MIESFEIENFRCFKKASLKDLRTINIIVGNNGSGKTALVEALAMAAFPTPLLATRIRMARNRPLPEQITWNRSSFEAFWEDLFFEFDTSKKIGLHFNDSLKGKYEIEIYYDKSQSKPFTILTGALLSVSPLIFNRIDKAGKLDTIKMEIDEKGSLKTEGNIEALPNFYAFASTQSFYTTDIVTYFSNLKEKGEHGVIVKAFQNEFPEIADISILLDATVPSLFATIKDQPSALSVLGVREGKKISKRSFPLTIISAGAVRYLNILLAIAATKNGIVIIDEIENGIYWKKMPNIWKTLRSFCYNNGVQLFATTHSYECLQALLPDMEKNVDDYSLIRAWINNMNIHNIKQFNGKSMQATLKIHGEIR